MDKGSDQTKLIATYFGAAFGILQIVDIVIDRVDLPAEIINYLLIAIIIGFIGILFYLYIPSLKNAKIEKIKDKKKNKNKEQNAGVWTDRAPSTSPWSEIRFSAEIRPP